MSNTLHLNLKKEYFEAIKNGDKTEEYRVFNDFWKKRLLNRRYDKILIKCGYPKKDDMSKILEFPYQGWSIKTIKHKHFGEQKTKVFAIKLNKNVPF